ncbi:MAG: nucleotidyltransferase family protein [Sneathiella sp.]|nr:nucleotidyltransferase family protein [Sneathiella sp.]
MRAMILAAGLGKRLRPLTDTCPKPLIKVAGRSLIDYSFDLLRGAGITDAVVNCHYLADQIETHVRALSDLNVTLSDERGALLETGGGVLKALPILGDAPFAVLNSDVIIRGGENRSLADLMDHWNPASMDALLLLQPLETAVGYQGQGDYHIEGDGALRRKLPSESSPYLFSGIQILNPSLFEGLDAGAFSLNKIYDIAEKKGRLFGAVHAGQWLHVGTEDALRAAEEKINLS